MGLPRGELVLFGIPLVLTYGVPTEVEPSLSALWHIHFIIKYNTEFVGILKEKRAALSLLDACLRLFLTTSTWEV